VPPPATSTDFDPPRVPVASLSGLPTAQVPYFTIDVHHFLSLNQFFTNLQPQIIYYRVLSSDALRDPFGNDRHVPAEPSPSARLGHALGPPRARRKRVRRVDQSTIVRLDQRTREARLVKRIKAELVAQVGGSPSPAQVMLIESIATLRLHCERLDQKAAENGGLLSLHDRKSYLAFRNSYIRALRALSGLKAASARGPSPLTRAVAAAARSPS
jgi:hypothetical protein